MYFELRLKTYITINFWWLYHWRRRNNFLWVQRSQTTWIKQESVNRVWNYVCVTEGSRIIIFEIHRRHWVTGFRFRNCTPPFKNVVTLGSTTDISVDVVLKSELLYCWYILFKSILQWLGPCQAISKLSYLW